VADGHTGALFLLSEDDVELTLSWGCLNMKMGSLKGVDASWASKSAFLRLVCLFAKMNKSRTGSLRLN
jgi:hypothetical protein